MKLAVRGNVDDEYRRQKMLSELPALYGGKELFDELRVRLDRDREQYEAKACCDDKNIKNDFRYLLGRINALKEILDIPVRALELISKIKE